MEFIGLLIIAWLGYVIIGGYNKAKSRRYYAVVSRAKRELTETKDLYHPTWINNDDKRHEFIGVVRSISFKLGVPVSYLDQLFKSEEFFRVVILKFTAILEQNNLSFTSQKTATSELIRDMWNGGVEIPPSNTNLQKIISFLDTKIFNSFDASAVAARLYLDANFSHAVDMYQNSNAVSFEKKYGYAITNEAKPFFDRIDVTNGTKHMDTNYPTCSIDMDEISRFITSCSSSKSSEDLVTLKLLAAEEIIRVWKIR